MNVCGRVSNSTRGVEVIAQGPRARAFIEKLRTAPPPLARVTSFTTAVVESPRRTGFSIVTSRADAGLGVDVLPDIATCADCREELVDPKDRRRKYPFINCTQCGPRYSIIESLPYDRPRTTMNRFPMCPDCRREYSAPADRRFHAQPDACAVCGPKVRLLGPDGDEVAGDAIVLAAKALANGKVVAIKSLGGFQLACDATNDRVVRRLRRRKDRPRKPLALMCRNVTAVRKLCRVNRASRELLVSPAAPIVLMPKKAEPGITVSPMIAPGNGKYGVMLAYTPLHVLLFNEVRRRSRQEPVLVMTSANRRDEPISATDRELSADLGGVFDLILTHNRPIANRCDDSVVLGTSEAIMSRRARGYAPQPIALERMFHVKRPVLALGGELRNCFALARGSKVYLSPHIGNVGSPRGERFFLETLNRYMGWTGIRPELLACDLHPDYASTRLAEKLSRQFGAPLRRIQHHYAHIVSVMAERGLRGPLLGLALDGTGYSVDGAIWGCEFLLVRPDLSWKRVGHLDYMDLTEGGGVLANPERVAAGYLLQTRKGVPPRLRRCAAAIRAKLDSGRAVKSSSLGRLLDAISGITGVCRNATFEGEAPIALEAIAADHAKRVVSRETRGWPRVGAYQQPACLLVDPKPLLLGAAQAAEQNKDPGLVAAWAHEVLAGAISGAVVALAEQHGVGAVALSGGSVQNDRLRRGIMQIIVRKGLKAEHNRVLPVNDGGVALGQAVAAGAFGA
jgi:hydrogenase maturation protein HypF